MEAACHPGNTQSHTFLTKTMSVVCRYRAGISPDLIKRRPCVLWPRVSSGLLNASYSRMRVSLLRGSQCKCLQLMLKANLGGGTSGEQMLRSEATFLVASTVLFSEFSFLSNLFGIGAREWMEGSLRVEPPPHRGHLDRNCPRRLSADQTHQEQCLPSSIFI